MTVTERTSDDSSEQTENRDHPVVDNAASADDANPVESKEKTMNQEDHEELVLRARGLPWSATADDVEKFFTGCGIKDGTEGIHFTFSRDGRPSGECFVEFSTVEDYQKALQKNNEHMGKRYVEVFESKHSEMDWVCKRMGATSREKDTETVVRLRGLPYGCSKEEVANFFKGLEIAPNGITIALDEDGKNTGDAYVEFASPDIASQAMNKHKEKIGHRYIEIFHSSLQEARSALLPKPKPLMSARPGPYDRRGGFGGSGRFGGQPSGFERRYRGGGRGGFGGGGNDFNGGNMRGGRGGRGGFGGGYGGGGGGYGGGGGGGGSGGFGRDSGGLAKSTTGFCVHMRGLPFSATEADVKQWFMPLNPVAIRMEFEISGSGTRRSRGEADVDFATDSDAKAAMGKDRQMMGHRYIELFLRSEADGDDDWSGGDQSFFSGNGMNFSSGGGFGNNFGNSGGGAAGGNFGGGGGNFGGGGSFGGGSGGGNNNFGGAGGGGGGGTGGGSSNYGGGYGGTSGQGGNFGNQGGGNMGAGNMGTTSTFFGVQVPIQGTNTTPNSLMGNMGGAGGNYGNQAGAGGGAMAAGANQSGYQQGTGYNQTNQTQANFSSTSAGAFNSASSFYGQDAKTGMVSYPTSY